MNWDFLKSRGFWVALSATAVGSLTLLGVDEKSTAVIAGIIAAWAAFFVVGETRRRTDGTKSYAEVQRLLRLQDDRLAALRRNQG